LELRQIQYFMKVAKREGTYKELIEAVMNGDFDMALIGPVPKHEKKIVGTTLFTDNIVAVLPTSQPLANQSTIKLSQFRDESFFLFPEEYLLRKIIVQAGEQLGFKPKVSLEGVDIDSIKGLVSAGLGVALIPEIMLVDGFPRSTVKVPIKCKSPTEQLGLTLCFLFEKLRYFYDSVDCFNHIID
jgi:LysR family transcriptional regulator, transcription activator of glutamate synthase operon